MEKRYEWDQAAKIYRQIMETFGPGHDAAETAKITELLAKSHFKAAFQSQTREEFKHQMRLAETDYEKSSASYEAASSHGHSKRTEARAMFANLWVQDDATNRENSLAKCIALVDEACRIFERKGDTRGIAEASRDQLNYLWEYMFLASEWKLLRQRFQELARSGDRAINGFKALKDDEGLLESLFWTLFAFSIWQENTLDPSEVGELEKKARVLLGETQETAKKIDAPHAQALACTATAIVTGIFDGDPSRALNLFVEGVPASQQTKDSFLIGFLSSSVSFAASQGVWTIEDVDDRREMQRKGLEFASISVKNLEISRPGALLSLVYTWNAECYTNLAIFVETESETKKALLQKAIEVARKAEEYEAYTASKDGAHSFSKALYFLATMDVTRGEKTRLLNEALPVREAQVRAEELQVGDHWSSSRNYLALIKAELSGIEKEPEVKIELLRSAVADMQRCVDQCARWSTTPPTMAPLARYLEWYGDIQSRLYNLTTERDTALRSVKIYEDAIAYLAKLEHAAAIAAIRWKIAKVYDTIGDHRSASEIFKKAAEDYRLGAEKIHGLASVFAELASYMEAWALIEHARLYHNDDRFLNAAENYSKVGQLLAETRTWRPLSQHYMGCSLIEAGEALSRQERPEAAIESFSNAIKSFTDSCQEIERAGKQAVLPSEKDEARSWIAIAQARERLCRARIDLEEAKVLDKRGEEEASAAKYRSASKIFSESLKMAENEQSRRELETLKLFSDAWAEMKEAEVTASPEMYRRAAESFAKVENTATRKRFRLLALANASICRALEQGTQFRRTRDTQLYSQIKKQLETATDYYEQAGLDIQAEWTTATAKLFDALVYMADAASEKESKKKTDLYHLAERHLELAAELYRKAGFASKSEEAQKHLQRARKEKELLLTPAEALAQNPAITGTVVAPVSLVRDQAVGLERFEAANLVGNLGIPNLNPGVGSELTIELELVNVGKTAATLIKLENVSTDGLELIREKIPHRVEDNYLDMKGRRLEYLKTHEVKIPLRAVRKGTYELRPRILFVDEKGNYRSYQFEATPVTVKELGISGWLKGPK